MLKEMVAERVVGMAIDVVNDNKEVILGVAVKGIKRIPKQVPAMAAGAVLALGGVYVYNKIKDRQEEKRNEMKEQMREEIIAELNNK
jgi:4-hydroxybenzoate polyprenyltransferase